METYVVVLRVEGVPAGVFRYLPESHKLLRVRPLEAPGPVLIAACYGQEFPGRAAAVLVWTAVPARTEWKYGYISHRMIAMEAGHVCQNVYLASEAIGAGACAVLAYDQERMDELIGADGIEEFTLYMATVGKPAAGASNRNPRPAPLGD